MGVILNTHMYACPKMEISVQKLVESSSFVVLHCPLYILKSITHPCTYALTLLYMALTSGMVVDILANIQGINGIQ